MSDNAHRNDYVNHFVRSENPGILNLQGVVRDLRRELPGDLQRKTPVVLVPGFAGWGKPFLGAVNYFGGFSDLASALEAEGYIVIAVRLSPLASNRERACEIFQQLTNINDPGAGRGFDQPGASPVLTTVNYGTLPLDRSISKKDPETWPAIVHGSEKLPESWKWSKDNKVTFICHSQGGISVRHLLYLLSGRAPADLTQFPRDDQRARVKAVITLGTPHKGSTVTDVAQAFLQGDPNLNAVVDLVTSCSFADRQDRVYDLGLDHWGFCRDGKETYQAMRQRIGPAVIDWWRGNVNGVYDNSIAGAAVLNALTATLTASPTYFFTMAFCATTTFPNRTLTHQDVEEFFHLFPSGGLATMFGIPWLATSLLNFANWAHISPPLISVLGWVTDVARRHLRDMGYFSQIPRPGEQIPRADMLLVIAPFAYGMGGLGDRERRPNDGIVNTVSMDGPPNRVRAAKLFVSELGLANPGAVKGRFWYFGENGTIDHADQLGVFTDATTNAEVDVMYKLFAELADRIP